MINTKYIQAILDGDKERLEELRNPPKTKLCYHFHRVHLSVEEGIKNNSPKEEFVCNSIHYLFPSHTETSYWFQAKESLLHKNSDTTCVCLRCTREFPLENMEKMARLFERMNELGEHNIIAQDVYFSDLQILKLYKELEPTWYQEDCNKNIIVLETENDPRQWAAIDECLKWNIVTNYAREFPVLYLPELGERGGRRYVCKHYRGHPYGIVTYKINTEGAELVLPRFGGGVDSLLFTNPYGVCKCRECRQIFSPQEQEQMDRLVSYLNTPHYYDEDTLAHHDEWKAVLDFYDETYGAGNEPYTLLNTDKILELTQGVEPVLYRETHRRNKAETIKKLTWNGKEWVC